jgi:RNA polymerase sigma-70 factor (ECF subfamily)
VQPHDAALRGWLRAKFPALGDVDDVVQETYARVLQLRARDPLRAHVVKPLLFTTARNLALDELRRRQIVPMYALPDDDSAALAADAPGIGETVGRREELALLAEAIQALPERCRQILTPSEWPRTPDPAHPFENPRSSARGSRVHVLAS